MWAWIAHNLRFQRLQRGTTGDEVAKILNCARSSISRLENDDAKLTEHQAEMLDKAWNTGGLFSVMVWYARLGHDPQWFKTFTQFEARASEIQMYDGQLIPALLQTPEYARALMKAGRVKDLEAAVTSRMSRQEILAKQDPPELWVLLAETALACLVGGREVMHAQLTRLLEVSDRPNVTLRVIPNTAGANGGLDGPFKIINVREGKLGFIEAPVAGRLVPDEAEVAGLELRFNRIGAVALPVDASRDLITSTMEAMR